MEKAKAKEKEKGERPGLARLLSSLVVFKALLRSLMLVKKSKPLHCFELGAWLLLSVANALDRTWGVGEFRAVQRSARLCSLDEHYALSLWMRLRTLCELVLLRGYTVDKPVSLKWL